MSLVGLDPASVEARLRQAGRPIALRGFGASVAIGAAGFTLASLAVFYSWAAGGGWLAAHFGMVGAYAFWAALFIGLGSLLLRPLVIDRGPWRFAALFALCFGVYAIIWTACWMVLPSRPGELLAAMAAPTALAVGFGYAFKASLSDLARADAWLIVGHAAGYFAGGFLYSRFPSDLGKLMWGACYGIGFGVGISAALAICQAPIRARLRGGAGSGKG